MLNLLCNKGNVCLELNQSLKYVFEFCSVGLVSQIDLILKVSDGTLKSGNGCFVISNSGYQIFIQESLEEILVCCDLCLQVSDEPCHFSLVGLVVLQICDVTLQTGNQSVEVKELLVDSVDGVIEVVLVDLTVNIGAKFIKQSLIPVESLLCSLLPCIECVPHARIFSKLLRHLGVQLVVQIFVSILTRHERPHADSNYRQHENLNEFLFHVNKNHLN